MSAQEPRMKANPLRGLEVEFEFVRELGRGGSSVVYLAIERELEREVAIKTIHPLFASDPDAAARLEREARMLARLEHPNIVTFYGIRRLADGGMAMVMQYVRGERLKDRIRAAGPLQPEEVRRVLIDVSRALGHAHRHRVVHRDIKPENIYLDSELGIARLSDFGIARAWDQDASLTQAGLTIGTPAYMAPEQIDGLALDGRSDIYSLGLVGWEMLTGQRPWDGFNLYGIIYRQKHESLPALASMRPDVPEALCAIIERALEKDPDRRWPTAEAFLARLAPDGELRRRMSEGEGELHVDPEEGTSEATNLVVDPAHPAAPARRRGKSAAPPRARPRQGASDLVAGPEIDDSPTIPYRRAEVVPAGVEAASELVAAAAPAVVAGGSEAAAEETAAETAKTAPLSGEDSPTLRPAALAGSGGAAAALGAAAFALADQDAAAASDVAVEQVAATTIAETAAVEPGVFLGPAAPAASLVEERAVAVDTSALDLFARVQAALAPDPAPAPRERTRAAHESVLASVLAGSIGHFMQLRPRHRLAAAAAVLLVLLGAGVGAISLLRHRGAGVFPASAARTTALSRSGGDPLRGLGAIATESAAGATAHSRSGGDPLRGLGAIATESAAGRPTAQLAAVSDLPLPAPPVVPGPGAEPPPPTAKRPPVRLLGMPVGGGSSSAVPLPGLPSAPAVEQLPAPAAARPSTPATPGTSASDISSAPTFTPYTVAPRLLNTNRIQDMLSRVARQYDGSGRIMVWIFVNEDGIAKKTQMKQSSGNPALDSAALEVAANMRFAPALNGDQHVALWVAVPIEISDR